VEQEATQQLQRGSLFSPFQNQDVEHLAFVIDSAPDEQPDRLQDRRRGEAMALGRAGLHFLRRLKAAFARLAETR
jgi:hypothetical protein